MTATDVIHQAATDLLGIPFAKGGRTRTGADCLGVVLLFLEELGVAVVDPWTPDVIAAASTHLSPFQVDDYQPADGEWRPIPATSVLELGDLFVTPRNAHVSVYVGGGYALSSVADSPAGSGSRLSAARDERASSRLWRFFR